jgi:hypothetical protein
MTDYYLAFPDEATAKSVIFNATQVPGIKEVQDTEYLIQGEIDEDGERDDYTQVGTEPPEGKVVLDSWPHTSYENDYENMVTEYSNVFVNTSVIGLIYKPTGEVDTEGYPVMVPIEGYHVNVRSSEELPELEQYRAFPETPMRVWG